MYLPLEDLAFAMRLDREEEIRKMLQRQLLTEPPNSWASLIRRFLLRKMAAIGGSSTYRLP